jgi:Asp/Glu/hydantoin racemase
LCRAGRDVSGARAGLVTCSAAPRATLRELESALGFPVVKIDEPMAHEAVRSPVRVSGAGPGIVLGVLVTYAPTVDPTTRLLDEAAREAGASVRLAVQIADGAYEALQARDLARHDTLLEAAADRLGGEGVDAVVLAQVSMARLQPQLARRLSRPVYSSLHSSVTALRRRLAESAGQP